MEYILVTSEVPEDLEVKVNNKIKLGFKPQGNLNTVEQSSHCLLIQPMIRTKTNDSILLERLNL